MSGLPRQFWLIQAKRRCSILFHLLVPGGKWQTVIATPISSASCCSHHFHKRIRAPTLRPPSAVISSRLAWDTACVRLRSTSVGCFPPRKPPSGDQCRHSPSPHRVLSQRCHRESLAPVQAGGSHTPVPVPVRPVDAIRARRS